MAFLIIAAITTFIIGILGLVNMNNIEKVKMNFNIFSYTLPFVAFIYDHSTKRLLNLGERSIYVFMKLIVIIYYLGAYVLALQQERGSIFYLIAQINFLIFPFLAPAYNYCLRKRKFEWCEFILKLTNNNYQY